jgi:hypothetical protein
MISLLECLEINAYILYVVLDFPPKSELWKVKVKDLKAQLRAKQLLFATPILQSQATTTAFFHTANMLVQHKKPLEAGETVKQVFLDAGNVLLDKSTNNEIKQAIKHIPLSCHSGTRQVEGMGENLHRHYCYFPFKFDESADTVDTSQITMLIRMVILDMSYIEKFLTMLPTKETTR